MLNSRNIGEDIFFVSDIENLAMTNTLFSYAQLKFCIQNFITRKNKILFIITLCYTLCLHYHCGFHFSLIFLFVKRDEYTLQPDL